LFALLERWSRIDQCGVEWLVGDRRVIGVTADAITIETKFGGRLVFYRKAPPLRAELSEHSSAIDHGPEHGGRLPTPGRQQMPGEEPLDRRIGGIHSGKAN
jgi:hypothetical protein